MRGEEAKMAEPVMLPKGTVTKQEFLEAVRDGLYNAMRERDRVPAVDGRLTAMLRLPAWRQGA